MNDHTEPTERSTAAVEAMAELWGPSICRAMDRPPNMIIYRNQDTIYMKRWYMVERNRSGSIYLHHYLDGDESEKPHDHPWESMSYCLAGGYVEEFFSPYLPVGSGLQKTGERTVTAGDVTPRHASQIHRIRSVEPDTKTLFFTGPNNGSNWGFWSMGGTWTHWRDASRDWTDEHGTIHSYPLETPDGDQSQR